MVASTAASTPIGDCGAAWRGIVPAKAKADLAMCPRLDYWTKRNVTIRGGEAATTTGGACAAGAASTKRRAVQ